MARIFAERTAGLVSNHENPGATPFVFEAIGLQKEFDDGQVQALRGVDFRIARRRIRGDRRAERSGKTTLLQMLGALDRPSAGTLKYRGRIARWI